MRIPHGQVEQHLDGIVQSLAPELSAACRTGWRDHERVIGRGLLGMHIEKQVTYGSVRLPQRELNYVETIDGHTSENFLSGPCCAAQLRAIAKEHDRLWRIFLRSCRTLRNDAQRIHRKAQRTNGHVIGDVCFAE